MKVVLFCGGHGLRLREAGGRVPKPLIPVGDEPILVHLMRYYAHFGHRDFIVCVGEAAHAFEEYFDGGRFRDWNITLADTGRDASVGERLRAVRPLLHDDEIFLANYGDQLSDAPLEPRIAELARGRAVASMLAVRPRYSTHLVEFGADGTVGSVSTMDDGSLWINGGYLVLRREIFDYLGPGEDLVAEPFARLIGERRLHASRYDGFWAPMDTLKEKNLLDALAAGPAPPWAVWQRCARPIPLVA